MVCRQLDKKREKDFFCVDGKKGWSEKIFKKGDQKKKKKMRTEKLKGIAKKLRRVSKVQTWEQEYAPLGAL